MSPGKQSVTRDGKGRNATFTAYLLLSLILILYVAVVTGARSEKLEADAWEHHRAVLSLSHDLWRPGNPTYASDDPSIRYSPYSVALAIITRVTGIDPYHILSAAAVFNTALMLVAVWVWLRTYGQTSAGPMVVLMLVFLYGQPPGYANSFALSDLPWHQVNPSAFAMPLVLFAWTWHRSSVVISKHRWSLAAAGGAVLISIAVLSHGMSGVLGSYGLFISAIAGAEHRRARISAAATSALAAFGLSTMWPWYDFMDAVRGSPDDWYWFNPTIVQLMLGTWCLPALVASLATLHLRSEPFIRTCLLATAGIVAMGLGSYITQSATLARLPLAGLIFPQAAVGVFLHRIGAASCSTWPGRLQRLFDRERTSMSPALVETLIVAMIVGLAIPNTWRILREPHLGRQWIAQLSGRADKQPHYWPSYQKLLKPHLLAGDVVLADMKTAWPVPSFGGRVVAALHLEYFTNDQRRRRNDVAKFFASNTDPDARLEILDRYDVEWILIDRDSAPPSIENLLVISEAIVAEVGPRVLMDADQWKTYHRISDPPGINTEMMK